MHDPVSRSTSETVGLGKRSFTGGRPTSSLCGPMALSPADGRQYWIVLLRIIDPFRYARHVRAFLHHNVSQWFRTHIYSVAVF